MKMGTPPKKAHHKAHGVHFRVSYMKIARWAMYVQCNNESRPGNHCCSGKAISITHSKKVFVALGTQ
jgi:hypothetical protein